MKQFLSRRIIWVIFLGLILNITALMASENFLKDNDSQNVKTPIKKPSEGMNKEGQDTTSEELRGLLNKKLDLNKEELDGYDSDTEYKKRERVHQKFFHRDALTQGSRAKKLFETFKQVYDNPNVAFLPPLDVTYLSHRSRVLLLKSITNYKIEKFEEEKNNNFTNSKISRWKQKGKLQEWEKYLPYADCFPVDYKIKDLCFTIENNPSINGQGELNQYGNVLVKNTETGIGKPWSKTRKGDGILEEVKTLSLEGSVKQLLKKNRTENNRTHSIICTFRKNSSTSISDLEIENISKITFQKLEKENLISQEENKNILQEKQEKTQEQRENESKLLIEFDFLLDVEVARRHKKDKDNSKLPLSFGIIEFLDPDNTQTNLDTFLKNNSPFIGSSRESNLKSITPEKLKKKSKQESLHKILLDHYGGSDESSGELYVSSEEEKEVKK